MVKSVEANNAKIEVEEIVSKCVKCGMCKSLCPVFRQIREETLSPRGKAIVLSKDLYDMIVFDCSLCKACEEKCPAGVKLCTAFRKARATFSESGKETKENREMIKNIKEFGNPFGKEIKKGKFYCC